MRVPSSTTPAPASVGSERAAEAVFRTPLTADGPDAAAAALPQQQGRLRFLEGLAAAASAINATLDLPTVLQVLVDRAAILLGVPGAALILVSGGSAGAVDELAALASPASAEQVRLAASRGLSDEYIAGQKGPLAGSITARALAEGRIFAAWDLKSSAAVSPREAQAAACEGITSVACAPMFAAGKPVGTLNLYCRAPQQCFTADQFDVLTLLAAQGAVAITNARLYAQSRLQAREIQASFGRVGAALAASLDSAQTLKLIVQLAGEMTRADAGAMFMLDSSGGAPGEPDVIVAGVTSLTLSAARGLHRRSIRLFRRIALSPLGARALRARRVLVVPDTRRHPESAFPALRSAAGDVEGDSAGADAPLRRAARSAVCVPVLVGGQPVGVLEVYAEQPNHFNRGDAQLLESFALQAAIAIENARLYAQERDVARTLQRSFLPELPDAIAGFEVGRIYVPASQSAAVGGDIYDLLVLPDGRVAAMIADVSGHGLLAASLTGMAKYSARAYALEDPDPARVLFRLNNALAHQTADSIFLTACFVLLDPRVRPVRVLLANAAHPPALVCRAPVTPSRARVCAPFGAAPGMIAGFRTGETYASHEDTLQTGDVLVLYTDGVTEARKRKTMFEQDRLRRVIVENAHRPAQEIAAAVYDAVANYVAPTAIADDIALLVLKAP